MNILVLGAAGFIGKNLVFELLKDKKNRCWLYDREGIKYEEIFGADRERTIVLEGNYCEENFEKITGGIDIVYHLISTTTPASKATMDIEIMSNVLPTLNLLNACVKNGVKKVVFLSSGGTVYGKNVSIPIKEDEMQNPICAYGIQKITIEKIIQLYHYQYGLDYCVIRLANPYGPYQNPLSGQGVISAFIYKALRNQELRVYGDGTVVRDYIFITDAIEAIVKIVNQEDEEKVYNIGSGEGRSINEIIECLRRLTESDINVLYFEGRMADVPINILDVSRYEKKYGKIQKITLEEGILRTMEFLKQNMF